MKKSFVALLDELKDEIIREILGVLRIEFSRPMKKEFYSLEEVSEITEAAMRGEIIDFGESLRKRVALLKGVPQEALDDVFTKRLRLNPGAKELVDTCKQHGMKVLLVSGGFTFFADRVGHMLNIDFTRSNVLEIADGHLTGQLVDQPWGDICDGAEKRKKTS